MFRTARQHADKTYVSEIAALEPGTEWERYTVCIYTFGQEDSIAYNVFVLYNRVTKFFRCSLFHQSPFLPSKRYFEIFCEFTKIFHICIMLLTECCMRQFSVWLSTVL